MQKSIKMEIEKPICVECGKQSGQKLFRRYTGGAIQLLQCEKCHKIIDKYVEYDAVILLLDVLLLRIQSYRHLLFNYDITTKLLCRVMVVLVLCEAYTKLKRSGIATPHVVTQLHFYSFFLQAILEMAALFVALYGLIVLASSAAPSRNTYNLILRLVVLSDYSKLCAIAAVIWSEDFYLWLPIPLVALSQLLSLNGEAIVGEASETLLGLLQHKFAVLERPSLLKSLALVLLLNSAIHGGSYLLEGVRTEAVQQLLVE